MDATAAEGNSDDVAIEPASQISGHPIDELDETPDPEEEVEEKDRMNSAGPCEDRGMPNGESHPREDDSQEKLKPLGNIAGTSSSLFQFVQDGFHLRNFYEHSKKLTELVDVTYNPRTKQFIFLDTRGITTWYKDGIGNAVNRSMVFPKYQNKLLRNIIYTRKYNVYFCLAKDFSLKVLNKDFEETCNVDSDLSSVMFLLFNPVKDELITGGVKGTKVWQFRQVADQVWREIKPMANYKLFLTKELKSVSRSWIKKVELNEQLQHIYCCSDTEVQCYDMDGKLQFKLERAHTAQINGCKYSSQARLLITCSNDTEVKVWSLNGGLINVFRGHSKAVTNVVLHPETSMMILTASLDGSIKIWSLDIMELIYSVVVSTEGIYWMGVTGEGHLWTATLHDLSIWHVDEVVRFYALARCQMTALHIAHGEGKPSRVVAVGEDSSVRLVSMKDQKNLSTVLPPPSVSPLTQVLSVAYNRAFSLVYLLINPTEIWVYTMKTDPACRTAVWDVLKIQERIQRAQSVNATSSTPPAGKMAPTQRTSSAHFRGFRIRSASAEGQGTEAAMPCRSLISLNAHIHYWLDQGFVCPRNGNMLLLGLEDGRILFVDPVNFGQKICELQACKDSILEMKYDLPHKTLVIKSHLREEDLFQFWSVPELQLKHEVLVTTDVTGYARLDDVFFTGHSDGSIAVHQLTEMADDPHAGLRHTGLSLLNVDLDPSHRPKEHNLAIIGMDSCPGLGIIMTCSSDGVIKVWDAAKTLLTEISLSQTLSTAVFLNDCGDLLIGYLNHLFFIDHTKVLSTAGNSSPSIEDIFETESEIYEDPAVRYEGAAANPDPLDLENYLVPFDLDLTQKFLAGGGSLPSSRKTSDAEDDEDSESQFSCAPTETYQSPAATPRRLSVVDMLVSKDVINKQEISENKALYSLKRRQSRRFQSFQAGRGDDFEFPRFGRSPGPSPTPTPPSTPSEASLSEVSSESEEDEEEEEDEEDTKEEEKTPLFPTTKEQAPPVTKMNTKPAELPPPDKEEPRYGLSRMKIDSKSLLSMKRQSVSSAVSRSAPSPQPQEQKSAESRPATAAKAPIKKKQQKANRIRVGQKSGQQNGATGTGDDSQLWGQTATKAGPGSQGKTVVGMSTVELKSQGSSFAVSGGGGGSGGGGRGRGGGGKGRPIVKKEKKKKQSIFTGYKKSSESGAGSGTMVGGLAEEKPDGETGDMSSSQQEEPEAEGTKTEGVPIARDDSPIRATSPTKSVASDGEELGQGASAMFKAANRLQVTQKYGPQHAKVAVTATSEPTTADLVDIPAQTAQEAGSAVTGGDAPNEEGVDAESDAMEEGGDLPDGSTAVDGSRERITPGRSKSAKESRVRFKVEDKRAKSAVPKLSGGKMIERVPETDHDDAASVCSLARTESEAELAAIPESRHSVFDETELHESPTPGISVSVVSKGSGRGMSLPDSRISSAFSRADTDLIHFGGSSVNSVFSPFVSPSPTAGRSSALLDEGRVSILMDDTYRRASYAMDTPGVIENEDGRMNTPPLIPNRVIPFSAPPEGRRARPNTAEGKREQDQIRPHTAGGELHVTFEDENFGSMSEAEFKRRMSLLTPTEMSGYFKNDGLQLDDKWQERMIERHKFLKMQKEQRARSAADRRQLLELRQRQRRKALLGHHTCSPDGKDIHPRDFITHSDSSLHMKRPARVKSAPAGPKRPMSWKPSASPPLQRKQAFVSQKDQRPDHHPDHLPDHRSSHHPDHRSIHHRSDHGPDQQSDRRTSQRSDRVTDHHRYQPELATERPYRFKMNSSLQKPVKGDVTRSDTVSRDPSSNRLLIKKPPSAKSIPSKPRRYVLLTQPGSGTDVMMPSSLEEQLLAKRFPKMHEKWHRTAPPPEEETDGAPPQRRNSVNYAYVNPLSGNFNGSPSMF